LSLSYPYNVDYELGDLVTLAHPIEYLGNTVAAGEVGLITRLYDKGHVSKCIYDCRILLKCGEELDCWFGELINFMRLQQ
jgi:hypothetical protein